MTDVIRRHHITQSGMDGPPMLFAHGFGCDQNMWRFVAPEFERDHRVICFDHVGCGRSDTRAWNEQRHATLDGYAADVVDIVEGLGLRDVIFVGHSVSSQIGMLASIQAPGRFAHLVMLGPSPRFLNDPPDYIGGFERTDIDALLDMMERNLLGFANFLAPLVMSEHNPVPLTDELRASICATDPYITRHFAMATFLSDTREALPRITVPSLLVQCSEDSIAPPVVGEYLHAHLKHSTLVTLAAAGHSPHMSHPAETAALIREYLARC